MLIMLLVVLLVLTPVFSAGSEKAAQTETILKELVSIWRKGGGWHPYREKTLPERTKDQQIQSVVRNLFGGLKTLGLLPTKSLGLPSFSKSLDRNRLSGFLYNISMYLQGVGTESQDGLPLSDQDDQFWENVLFTLIQLEGDSTSGHWDEKVPPRPSFRLQDLFLSLRGSPHWDGLLGLVQTILSFLDQQPQRSLLTFLSQNWKTISALLETILQALVSGTYGQASAGIQGFICVLKGHSDCAFNMGWLQQLMSFLETRNWKPVVNLHPGLKNGDQQGGSFGRFKPFSMLPGALTEESLLPNQTLSISKEFGSMQSLLLQALSRSSNSERTGPLVEPNPALLRGLDSLRRGLLRRVGSTVYGNLRRKVSRVTVALLDEVTSRAGVPQANHQCSVGDLRHLILWGIRHNLTWNTQALGFSSQDPPGRPQFFTCISSSEEGGASIPRPSAQRPSSSQRFFSLGGDGDHREDGYPASAEILEAACNDSIPGLSGVSNFTVFLYCNLFDGSDDALDSTVGHIGPDLHVTCSDAAWYLSAAEDDFLWVHVCSEFFAHEFNNTVCANSSFWLQRAHLASLTKDFHYFNQSSIDDLCMQLSSDVTGGSGPDVNEECLVQLGARSLSAQDFRRCFFPNNSALVTSLCGNVSSPVPQEGSWAAEYCSKVLNNSSHNNLREPKCDYKNWEAGYFLNSTLLELCGGAGGLRDSICQNATLYRQLAATHPWIFDFCSIPAVKSEENKCFLQRLFDMLPAPYNFDTSQLCVNPAPIFLEALYRISQCEGGVDEGVGWLGTVSYVLRFLDFVVGLSAGLEEGVSEVRQGLGQAILLSSLLDNTSFWATLQSNASLSVLHTVGVFLRKEQNPSIKEDLLSCFSPVLWDLIQRDKNSSALRVLLQEYLQMPRESIRTLLMSAEKEAVKRFLSHMHQSWDQLQVETTQVSQKEHQAMETMTSAFIHKFPRVTPDLFVDLSQFIPFMSVADIMNFPASLMVNDSVLMAIRDHSSEMKSPQKRAFVKRLLQSRRLEDVPSWPPYFLSSILPLLPYLPVCHFQQLTFQQLSPLLEALGNSSLDDIRGRHVLRTVYSKKRNLTNDDLSRMGSLVCYLSPEELHPLLLTSPWSQPLWQKLATCMSEGLTSSSGRPPFPSLLYLKLQDVFTSASYFIMAICTILLCVQLSHWLVRAVQPLNISTLPPPILTSLHGLLPQLGASFLQPYSPTQLLNLLSQQGLPSYPPAQAFQILNKAVQDSNLRLETLCELRPLLSGLSPSVLGLLSVPSPGESSYCQCWRSLLSELHPGRRAILHAAFQKALGSISGNITLQLHCLVPFVSLKTLMLATDGADVLRHISLYRDLSWSPQQAQLLYKKILQAGNITRESIKTLGHITGGMSCDRLRLLANDSDFSELLQPISELPGVTQTLRKCVVEELQKRPGIDLNGLSPSFSAALPVKMVESLSNASFIAVLDYIRQHFIDFLQLPRHKQTAFAGKAASVLVTSQEEGISGATLDLLGPLMPFLDRDMFGLVDREALRLRLDEMKSYCLPKETLTEIAKLLTERGLLGEPASWTVEKVEHAGRLVFAFSLHQINLLPLDILTTDTVEQILESQRRWEDSEVGRTCEHLDGQGMKREGLVRGIIKGKGRRRKEPVPSCADIKGTFPSAWRAAQLGRMEKGQLEQCVEDLGQDDSLSSEQRRALWTRLRQAYGPAKSLSPERILELGCLVTEMSDRELQETNLANLGIVAQLGSLTGWSPRKMRAAMFSFLRHSGLKLEELEARELASLGYLLCGLSPSEISRLDPEQLSLATLFLRELALPCSEQQAEALTSRLSSTLGFGPVSSWGSEVFTEIGTLAVGLADIVMSALVREQIEGLTPTAISLIPPSKLNVVFSAAQLSWMSPEQASAVTEEQWAHLGSEQRQALTLAQYEGEVILEHRANDIDVDLCREKLGPAIIYRLTT